MLKTRTASILILTLWMLSFMTVFTAGLAHNVSGQLRLASHIQDRLKMYYLAKAGIERATIKFEMDETPNYTSLNEEWANSEDFFKEIPCGDGYVSVSYQLKNAVTDEETAEEPIFYGLMDESSKININKAPLQILKNMLKNIGEVDAEEAADIANAIIDWRDIDVIVSPNGAENEYYEGLDTPYPCKNGDFQISEELLLVKGMSPDIFLKIADTITIYSEGKVNINTADWQTFHALGLSSELAQRVIQYRSGRDEIVGTEDDNIFKTVAEIRNIGPLFTEESVEINSITSLEALTVKSNVFRINSTGILKKGDRDLRMDITCVVKMARNKNPEMLYWHEY